MARVENPLFSDKASGKFADSIVFRCGKFATKVQKEISSEISLAQKSRREKFAEACAVWRNVLTDEQRAAWQTFILGVRFPDGYYRINVAGSVILVQIGFRAGWRRCIGTGRFNGFHYWISAFLRFGEDGWLGYPNPPEYGD